MENKYSIGDKVIISKSLTPDGHWVTIEEKIAKILDIHHTISFGPAHVLEIDGERCRICYWESDIDGRFHESR